MTTPTESETTQEEPVVHILWINAGLSCDGDSVALTAATQPSIEEIVLGALPGLPKIAVHWPLIDYECGPDKGADTFIEWFYQAERGELEPFVLVVEGSIPNESIKSEGYWSGFGNNPATGQPRTTSEWLDILAPKATAVLAVGTCATYGGIHAMAGNPTGAMGVADYLPGRGTGHRAHRAVRGRAGPDPGDGRERHGTRARRRRADRLAADRARPASAEHRRAGPQGARPRAALPRVALRRRRTPGHRHCAGWVGGCTPAPGG
jgi:hypothetical protein